MTRRRITVVRADASSPPAQPAETIVGSDELRQWLRTGRIFRELFGGRDARLLTYRLRLLGRPLFLAALVRALGRGRCWIEDEQGSQKPISTALLARWAWDWQADRIRKRAFVGEIDREVAVLEGRLVPRPMPSVADLSASPVYLRTDLSFHLQAGGSVGHVAGVLNAFHDLTGPPVFITPDVIPTVRPGIETHFIDPCEAFWNFRELPALALNARVVAAAAKLRNRPLSFLYHRYCVNTFAAVPLALSWTVPFVLEYNGSEVWVSRHWGERLEFESLTERIERLNLAAADLIVVVSRALADELTGRGFPAEKILVNPNGVDPDRYHPGIDDGPVRKRFQLEGKTVVGFIGTFGPWHGAEVLVRAFAAYVAQRPERREQARLLMIGDGVRMPDVQRLIAECGIEDIAVCTGVVPQEQGPAYLAACDLLIAPHVPNADGSPFFGSPTKLFEYMAMGKAIVASNLDQIGEVLEHGTTAWLVAPGDVDDLARGIARLVDDRDLRGRLGAAARAQVLASHTWRQHTKRTIDRLSALRASPAIEMPRLTVRSR